MKKLNYPFNKKEIRNFKVGDMVLISGKLFTGRDAVHKYLHEGGKSPVDFNNQIIFIYFRDVCSLWNWLHHTARCGQDVHLFKRAARRF